MALIPSCFKIGLRNKAQRFHSLMCDIFINIVYKEMDADDHSLLLAIWTSELFVAKDQYISSLKFCSVFSSFERR